MSDNGEKRNGIPRRVIDVRRQTAMPFSRVFGLVAAGIRHRLFRSLLTLSVIVLAVAFFMAMTAESVAERSTAQGVRREIREQRLAATTLNACYVAPSAVRLSGELARLRAGRPGALSRYAFLGEVSSAELSSLAARCEREQTYLAFFRNLPVGQRIGLIKKRSGRAIFRHLYARTNWEAFLAALGQLRGINLPPGPEADENAVQALRSFVEAYPALERDLAALEQGIAAALARLGRESRELTGVDPDGIAGWLARADGTRAEAWLALVGRYGFGMDRPTFDRIRADLAATERRRELGGLLTNDRDLRERWRRAFPDDATLPLDDRILLLSKPENRALLAAAAPTPSDDGPAGQARLPHWNDEQWSAVASRVAREKALGRLEARLPPDDGAAAGAFAILSGRQAFLLAISFVVCMVGIANAMLMAITERFREIATMKCLGATDRFILTQFMLEAALQGFAGGLVGMAAGLLLAVLRGWLAFGGYFWQYASFGGLLGCGAFCVSTGVLLSVSASLYPSWSASRMAPMEAMRVE